MERQFVRVAPHILDLADAGGETQEALFVVDGKSALKLDNNEATIGPSPLVIRTIIQAVTNQGINIDADVFSRRLRRKISHYTGANYDSIACFSGRTAAIEVLAKTYLAAGLESLISWPAEQAIADIFAAGGATHQKTNYRNIFMPTVEQIVELINPKTRLIYIGNPANPTGACLSEAEIVFLLSYAEGAMVVIDESYYEFSGMTVVDLTKKFANLAVLRTFDKAFAVAGAPSSYIVTDCQNLRFMNRLGQYNHPDMLAQAAAEAALDDISYMVDYIRQVNRSKKMLLENLGRMGYDFVVTAANYLLIRTSKSETFAKILAKNNIYVRDLSNTPAMNGFIQMAIGTPSQTEIVLDLLGRLSREYAAKLDRNFAGTIGDDPNVKRDNIPVLAK
jgi:histidinol-phosphate aminotransferase